MRPASRLHSVIVFSPQPLSRCGMLLRCPLQNAFLVAEFFHAKSLYSVLLSFNFRSQKLAAYAKLSRPALAPFGARYLAIGNATAAYEHGLKQRIVIIEFPSIENAIAARESAAYGEALKALGDGAVRNFRIVEGVE